MAAISAARGAPTALTPPSSSHGDEPSWRYRDHHEEAYGETGAGYYDDDAAPRTNGNSNHFDSRKMPADEVSTPRWDAHAESGVQSPEFDNIRSNWSTGEPETDDVQFQRGRADSTVGQEVESKWIHRDKLAQIENEELQAAGFVPRSRAPSKQRRDKSARRGTDASEHIRSKQDQTPESADTPTSPWDLKVPDEAIEEGNASAAANAKAGSRIPVFKTRSRSGSATLRELAPSAPIEKAEKPKPVQRSTTESSPKKPTAASRKNSEPVNSKPNKAAGRPKTRSGPSKDSTNSNARPSTRSGEATLKKQPEGNPPWMVDSYRPDPRLPPDQQIIPTVAKRLMQEKWEQEGKFGDAYDKDFRPLNDNVLPQFRESSAPLEEAAKQEPPAEEDMQIHDAPGQTDEWPLKAEAPKSPPQARLGSSYSTMPKISDIQPPKSPLPGQRPPMTPQGTQGTAQSQSQLSEKAQSTQRIPDVPDDQDQKGGCGCCVIM
ncbi:hypothetical protein TsFJ059_005897 [Trichoderma semiorbis]|uniref:TeaA receptor TeaR n=1 Tax=Trichoderma semiorbis TaxID=1491008 RepID=A0A9P8HIB4_9HYPO|nr:hypothetical protein TsFJ059_005897 [Trichoderma semiorbis]